MDADGDAGDDAGDGTAVLDELGDPTARHVLATVGREPRSAKEIAAELDLSLPTVYRRLDSLAEEDLISQRTAVGEDGSQYGVYDATFRRTVVTLEDGGYDVRVFRDEGVPDRFSRLWDELSDGGRS